MCISLGHTSRLERNHTEAPLFSCTSGAENKGRARWRNGRVKKGLIIGSLAVAAYVFAAEPAKKFFFCKNCGSKFTSVQSLTSSSCLRHPSGKGSHELYEGSTKPIYTCKYCGRMSRDLKSLTSSKCVKHPKGFAKGNHSPAL